MPAGYVINNIPESTDEGEAGVVLRKLEICQNSI